MKLEQLTNEIVDASEESCLLDFQGEGELLAICFGFYDAAGKAQFDFYKRLKKLETLSGKKINKLLLRDKNNAWYHHGVEGLGKDVDETTVSIRKIIKEIKPSKIITIGQSMGGYAAIMYGALLEADKVISFGPLSCFDADKLEVLRDYRWLDLVKKIQSTRPKVFYDDLPKLLAGKKRKTEFEIFYGTHPGENAERMEAVNYDAAHAYMFYGLAGMKLFPLHNSPHAVVEYMRVNKIINAALLNRIFGLKAQKDNVDIGLGAEWMRWVEENIQLGCNDKQLIDTLTQNKFTSETAIAGITRVHAKLDLERILTSYL